MASGHHASTSTVPYRTVHGSMMSEVLLRSDQAGGGTVRVQYSLESPSLEV